MSRTWSGGAVAVTTVVVAALVVVGTMGSLGSVVAFAAGGLVVLGAAVGRLRLALVPVAIAAGLAALVVAAPSPDLEDWTPAIATVLALLGIGGALCIALGALIRRVGRAIRSGEGSPPQSGSGAWR
jgi:hypothetical protein